SAARTCYALTDRRALILSLGAFGALEVKSFRPDALGAMKRVEYADGSGSLVFEEVPYAYTDSQRHSPAGLRQVGFLGINDVRAVEELLWRTLLGSDVCPPDRSRRHRLRLSVDSARRAAANAKPASELPVNRKGPGTTEGRQRWTSSSASTWAPPTARWP